MSTRPSSTDAVVAGSADADPMAASHAAPPPERPCSAAT
jgi:hypothetical protein